MSRGARSVAQTKARFTGPPAFPDSLLFSPHGEAKCVRGPSGLGASRAEEKGASRLARAGVLEQYVEHGKQAQRNHGGHIVCFDRRVVGNAGYSNPKPRPTVFHESRITSHETRLFFSVVRDGWRHRKPPSGPLPPPASRCFPVRHCSAKKLFCAIALAPPGRCFPARCGAAWCGYGAAWAAAVPRAGNTDRKVFTNHETRNTRHGFYAFHETRITQHGFPLSLRRLQGEQPQARPTGFSRITRHESRITAFMLFFPRFPTISHDFPAFPTISRPPHPPGKGSARRSVAALLRVVARHGAAMARHGRPPSPAPATRPVGFSPATRHATWVFPIPPATPGRTAPSPANRFFTNHVSRGTNHGLYAFVAAFQRVVERHGAAMERHGWPPSPAPATRPVGFSPATRHATWVFPIPPATPRRTAPSPANVLFTNHETRNTNHGLLSRASAVGW